MIDMLMGYKNRIQVVWRHINALKGIKGILQSQACIHQYVRAAGAYISGIAVTTTGKRTYPKPHPVHLSLFCLIKPSSFVARQQPHPFTALNGTPKQLPAYRSQATSTSANHCLL